MGIENGGPCVGKALVDSCHRRLAGAHLFPDALEEFKVETSTLTAQNGMLTPSLKVKRRVVWGKYAPQIEALYTGAEKGKGATAPA